MNKFQTRSDPTDSVSAQQRRSTGADAAVESSLDSRVLIAVPVQCRRWHDQSARARLPTPQHSGSLWKLLHVSQPPFKAATFTRSAMLPLDNFAQSYGGGLVGLPHSRLQLSPDLQCCPWTAWPRATEGGWGGDLSPPFETATFTRSEILPLQ